MTAPVYEPTAEDIAAAKATLAAPTSVETLTAAGVRARLRADSILQGDWPGDEQAARALQLTAAAVLKMAEALAALSVNAPNDLGHQLELLDIVSPRGGTTVLRQAARWLAEELAVRGLASDEVER